MADNPDVQELIRTRRIEVVDGAGRPRVVLGDLSGTEEDEAAHGIAVLDKAGQQRAWLDIDEEGVTLAFDRNGNAVLELGVEDGTGEGTTSGVKVRAADVTGRPVVNVHIHDDGQFVIQGATPQ